jgi:NAD-specific glutamate dehydrogenase
MPKEELFLASAEEIGKEIEAILTQYYTQEVKVTLRRDRLGAGVSIMVIMPRTAIPAARGGHAGGTDPAARRARC